MGIGGDIYKYNKGICIFIVFVKIVGFFVFCVVILCIGFVFKVIWSLKSVFVKLVKDKLRKRFFVRGYLKVRVVLGFSFVLDVGYFFSKGLYRCFFRF